MNQDAVKVPVGEWTKKRLANMSFNDLSRQESATGSKVGRKIAAWEDRELVYPSNVLHFSPVAHNTGHSAAFPEWLPAFFIRLFTHEGDVVLDPFLGSGTTYRVATQLGRIPVGIENRRNSKGGFGMMSDWIASSDFEREVARLQTRARRSFDNVESRRVKNVVDPFLTLVIASTFGLDDLDDLGEAQRFSFCHTGCE